MNQRTDRTSAEDWPWPLVAVAGWLLPGLGHWLLGERRRARILGGALLGLFAAGVLIGSIDVVDRNEDTIWFAGEALLGPVAVIVSQVHVINEQPTPPRPPEQSRTTPGYHRSIGRVNELGTLYCTMAGALNLLAILDAVGRSQQPRRAPARGQPA